MTTTEKTSSYSIDSINGKTLAIVETSDFQEVLEIAQVHANLAKADVVVWQMSNGQDDVDETDALTISPNTH